MGNCFDGRSYDVEYHKNQLRWKRIWTEHERPATLGQDGALWLTDQKLVFNTTPPDPYPDWLRGGMSPQEFWQLVMDIDHVAMEAGRGVGPLDEITRLNKATDASVKYVASIADHWRLRGIDISYRLGKMQIHFVHGDRSTASVNHMLRIGPVVADSESTGSGVIPLHNEPGHISAVSVAPLPSVAPATASIIHIAGAVPITVAERSLSVEPNCRECGAGGELQAKGASFCSRCGKPLRRLDSETQQLEGR